MTMQHEKTNNPKAGQWKRMLSGVLAVLLLLPVPAFAALDFSGLTWSLADNITSGAATDPSIGGSFGNLTGGSSGLFISLAPGTYNSLNSNGPTTGTLVYTGTGITTDSTGSGTMFGTWSVNGVNTLGYISKVSVNGTSGINVTVTASDTVQSNNNMFGGSYTRSGPVGSNPPADTWTSFSSSNPPITLTVTFTFNSASYTVGSTPITLTLSTM